MKQYTDPKIYHGEKYITESNYVVNVQGVIRDVKKSYKPKECKPIPAEKIKEFHNKMLNHANVIFNEVINFHWLITPDGMDYAPDSHIGCYNDCRTITEKRGLVSNAIQEYREKDSIEAFAIRLAEKFIPKGGIGCKDKDRNRNHKVHGCQEKRDIQWTDECRYIIPNEDIQKLQDT